jgi:2',5'-phosphodiesterase
MRIPGFFFLPPCPRWFHSRFVTKYASLSRFRVVSYNILADLYADSEVSHKQLYPYCPPYALGIDYRKQLILKELLGESVILPAAQELPYELALLVFVSDTRLLLNFVV